MIPLFSTDPSKSSFYFPVILGIIVLLGLIQLIIYYYKNLYSEDQNSSLNYSLDPNGDYSKSFVKKTTSLKFRYLLAYLLTRASVWAKSPYIWSMYLFYHKFSVTEIGILYVVDAVSALIFGPITGNLADIFGRRRFCQLYNFSVCLNLALRLSRNHVLAYMSQVVTGIGAGLANTAFESWVVSESIKEFKQHEPDRERFLKKLFKTVNIFDACLSIVISACAAIIYNIGGVLAPIVLSIIFSALAMLAIEFTWEENEIQVSNKSMSKHYGDAFQELKKRDVFCVGLSESLTLAVQNLFLFAWTPILLASTESNINIGFIFLCLVTTIILGTKLFEVAIMYIKLPLYTTLAITLFFECCLFLGIYFIDVFVIRLLLLACVNGISGMFNPLMSIIKSKVLEEKQRALLMNIFRVPLNAYVILVLLLLKYMNPFTLCLVAATMAFVAFCSIFSLVIFPVSHKPAIAKIVDMGDNNDNNKKKNDDVYNTKED